MSIQKGFRRYCYRNVPIVDIVPVLCRHRTYLSLAVSITVLCKDNIILCIYIYA